MEEINFENEYARYIDEYTIEIAPTNYENISNFNLDKELMMKYGFYPITIVNPEEVFKWPSIRYTLGDKIITGERFNKEPELNEYKQYTINKAQTLYKEYLDKQVIYVNDISYDRNLYTINDLTAMIVTGDSYQFKALDGSINELNTDNIKKFLSDKLYIENKYSQTHESICDEINSAKSNDELEIIENTRLAKYPIIYYKITELHNLIRDENILNNESGHLLTVLNIGAYFSDETRVYYGEMGFNGKDYLDEHHIPYIKLSYPMGSIAGSPGDLNLDINFYLQNEQPKTVEILCDAMKNLGFNSTIDNNDILIDGKKCCGCTTLRYTDKTEYRVSYIHISFTVNKELIDIVRVKPQVKDVIGLKDVIPTITRETLLAEFEKELIKNGYRNTK